MWNCNLCGNQTSEYVVSNLCSKCNQIAKIIELYDIDKVLATLRFIYLRDEYDKIENREKAEAKKIDQECNEKMTLRSDKKK